MFSYRTSLELQGRKAIFLYLHVTGAMMQLSANTTYCTLTKKTHVFLLNLQEYVRNLLCVNNNSLSIYILCESRCSLKWHNLSLTRWQLSHSSNISASECLMLERSIREIIKGWKPKGHTYCTCPTPQQTCKAEEIPINIFTWNINDVHISKWIPVRHLPDDFWEPVYWQTSFFTLWRQ